ncbi:MAG TPA: MFS transporter [Fimbriiglobus sp.]|nr:MFS transporter [Fimbriiglobus sp.]
MTPDTDTPAPPDPARRSAVLTAFLVTAIDLLGFGIVLPLVPRYAEMYLAGTSDAAKGAVIGLLYSSFSLMQFIFAPMWGRLSDRIGRRPVLLLSLGGSVAFYALFAVAAALPAEQSTLAIALLLASRVGAGIAGASVSTAAAVIADCTPPEKRAKGMALIGAAFGIGFTFGPLIAWAGEEVFLGSPWGPGAAASGLSLVALILAAAIFKETLPPGPRPKRELFSLTHTAEVLRMPTVGPLVLIYFLAIFAFANFEGTLSLFTEKAFHLGRRDNYLVFAYVGLVLMLAQGGLYRPLAGRRSEESLMRAGVAMMLLGLAGLAVVAFAAYEQATGLKLWFYASMTVAVTGFSFVNPSVAALVSKRSDPSRQGEVLGVNQSFASLGRILGPFVGSYVFFLNDSRVLPFAVAAAVLLGVALLLPRVTNHRVTEGTEGRNTEKDKRES